MSFKMTLNELLEVPVMELRSKQQTIIKDLIMSMDSDSRHQLIDMLETYSIIEATELDKDSESLAGFIDGSRVCFLCGRDTVDNKKVVELLQKSTIVLDNILPDITDDNMAKTVTDLIHRNTEAMS